MRKYCLLFLLFTILDINGQLPYKYRVLLKDKQGQGELLDTPERLLSTRALARRGHHEILVDSTDLPVSPGYVRRLEEAGFPFVCASRWLNSIVVASDDSAAYDKLLSFPFVKEARLVWKDNFYQQSFFVKVDEVKKTTANLGKAPLLQLDVHCGEKLHQAGYRGAGMWIAVIDAGFLNADKIGLLNQRILGTRDFVDPQGDIYSTHPHGTNVLSIMTTPPFSGFSGSAPEASYWLLRSEDSSSEYPVEEDYWIAAAEYADSLGVDVINSSLGYSLFDDSLMNYQESDITGQTAFITQGASFAASKGMLVVNSAGNERQKPWRRISFPADSPDILTVGAVKTSFEPAPFTSEGFVEKEFVKPDIAGIGDPTYLIDETGALTNGSGTSFSTPVITGLASCLWQARPQLKNFEIIRLLREYASRRYDPDALAGYGIPDVMEAYTQTTPLVEVSAKSPITLLPVDSTAGLWKITGLPEGPDAFQMNIFNTSGGLADSILLKGNDAVFDLNHLQNGLYIIRVQSNSDYFTQRIYLSGK